MRFERGASRCAARCDNKLLAASPHDKCVYGDASQLQCIPDIKTSTLPPVRVADDLRAAAEGVLAEGESLSSFIESTVRKAVDFRREQAAFHARGQAAFEHYQRTGVSHSADDVLDHLQQKLDARRKQVLG